MTTVRPKKPSIHDDTNKHLIRSARQAYPLDVAWNVIVTASRGCNAIQMDSLRFLLHILASDAADDCNLTVNLAALLTHLQSTYGVKDMNHRVAILAHHFGMEGKKDPLFNFPTKADGSSWD
jgi:hypothetical protein